MKFAVDQQLKLGIVGNGDDATLGNMDEARVQTVIDELTRHARRRRARRDQGRRPGDQRIRRSLDWPACSSVHPRHHADWFNGPRHIVLTTARDI